MKNWWIRFGCFMTGHNYMIIKNSSEVAAKAVKRYTAAMVIVCILWSFIGFTFTQRYLQASLEGCIMGAVIAVIIIIQIERQIILSMHPNAGLYIFRGCLAFMMALLGAVIIDQIILKQDIELEKISYISNRVEQILPSKTAELKSQTLALDSTIELKEKEKQGYINDVAKTPVISFTTSQTQSLPIPVNQVDSVTGREKTVFITKNTTSVVKSNAPNPKQFLIGPLDTTIAEMRRQKAAKEDKLLNIRPALENEIKEKIGFLDELKVMYNLISNSYVALGFWLLWLLFFLFIEMLVLFSKIGDKTSDYEKTVLHHMTLQIKRLDALAKASEGSYK